MILIGTPVYRAGAYALDKFLANQQQIQRQYSSCELVLATCEDDFIPELNSLIDKYRLKAKVVHYETVKPDYAKNRVWNISCGREVLRKYMLSVDKYEGLLFLDADMTFEPSVVEIMTKEIEGYDAVFSGYHLRQIGICLTGAGCLLLARNAMEKVKFRCYEFKNGERITEDNVLEIDLFREGARIKKGFFLVIDHYFGPDEFKHIEPQKVRIYDRIMTSSLFRYCLINLNVLFRFNLSSRLFTTVNKFRAGRQK